MVARETALVAIGDDGAHLLQCMDDVAAHQEALSPPILVAADGTPRRVGVEIEFLGPTPRLTADALAHDLGGVVESEDPHAFRIHQSRHGEILIETDLRYLHAKRHPNLGHGLGTRTAAWLGRILSPAVPRELITSPVPIARLPAFDEIVASLRGAGAWGRGAVLFDSLGLHFNIDPPHLGAETLTAFLKAFLLLRGSLRHEIAQGRFWLSLTLPPDYPPAYVQRVLAPEYWPDLPALMADYLAANPTRKRGLDLLPLLAYLDEDRVRSVLPREKIGPRPALHYRLPQAHLSVPDWSILPDWSRWIAVERLASDHEALCRMGAAASRV